MIELLKMGPDHVVAARLSGPASSIEFDTAVRPALDAAVARYGKARVLIEVPAGPAAEASIKGLLEGGGLGMGDLRRFDRLALVSDLDWLKRKLSLFGLLAPCKIKRFDEQEAARAWEWVAQH